MVDFNKLKQEVTDLVNLFLPNLKKNNTPTTVSESLYSSHNTRNNTYVKIYTAEEYKLFYQPIERILKEAQITERYSEEYIQKELVELYHNLLLSAKNMEEKIDAVLRKIVNTATSDFFVMSELENIRVEGDGAYEILDSVITLLKDEQLPFDVNSAIGEPVRPILGKPIIFTKVKAVEFEKAKQIARHNFLTSFNLLKLYAPSFKPVLKGSLLSGRRELIAYDKTTITLHSSHSLTGDLPLNQAYLNRELYEKLKSLGLEEINNLTELSRVVRESLYWYGFGLEEKHPSAKLLNFVTVLEAVLKKKSERTELTKIISERAAILLSAEPELRKHHRDKLKDIYNERSVVVHTGALKNDENLANLSGAYARSILINAISCSKEFQGNFEKFIEHLDDVKLGDAPKCY